ncbi:MAG: DciA family protein [Alphaproteobacteria bacterium]|jgi:hypothetical protein|nr:DciA family protein [Alphaproteobacteria bacterium]
MDEQRASRGPRQAASYLSKITRGVLGKRGLTETEVVFRWSAVVGERLAARCLPERLAFPREAGRGGVLHLLVEPAAATEIQHLAPTILERINTYYGYRAVDSLRLRQQPLPEADMRPARRQPSAAERQALERELAAIDDPELRRALASLGAGVMSTKRE